MYILQEITRDDNNIFTSWLEYKNINEWMGGIEDWAKYFEYVNSEPDYFLVKAVLDNKIIGAIWLEIIDGIGYIGIMVNPDEQNKGHGTKILSLFLQQINKIIKRDIKQIHYDVDPKNIASRRCCEKCGFEFAEKDEDGFMNYIYKQSG